MTERDEVKRKIDPKRVHAALVAHHDWENPGDDPAGLEYDRMEEAIAAADAALPSSAKALEEALTPSAETKAAYIGEFTFSLNAGVDEFGDDHIINNVQVPWTTIKEIMKAIRDRAALPSPPQEMK